MPRRKREERYLGLECVQCHAIFDAVREDAKTCSARCRVAFNRDKKAAARAAARRNVTLCLMAQCSVCKKVFDLIVTPLCPVCQTWTPCGPTNNNGHGELLAIAASSSTSSAAST